MFPTITLVALWSIIIICLKQMCKISLVHPFALPFQQSETLGFYCADESSRWNHSCVHLGSVTRSPLTSPLHHRVREEERTAVSKANGAEERAAERRKSGTAKTGGEGGGGWTNPGGGEQGSVVSVIPHHPACVLPPRDFLHGPLVP